MTLPEADSEPRAGGSASRRVDESPVAEAEETLTPIPVGDLVSGRWIVDSVIGHGAMGVVCAAHHIELGQRVAVKFLRASLARNESVVERFLDEARAASALQGEHIVRVFDVGQTQSGLPYFVMEYLEGVSLEARLRQEGPLAPAQAVDFMLQACDGLREAHAGGIVHRDVKPENLLIIKGGGGRREVVKLVDFGIAKRLDASRSKIVTGPQDRIGSPCYMSPEQMTSPRDVDPRTDVWGLGVLLYQSLTGRLPFDGSTLEEVFQRIQTADAIPPSELRSGIDFRLDAIVARCLRKDPNDRYPSVAELATDLDRFGTPSSFLSTTAIDEQVWHPTSRTEGPVATTQRPRASGPTWLAATIAVVGAALTLTIAVVSWRHDSEPAAAAAVAPVPIVDTPKAAAALRDAVPPLPSIAAAAAESETDSAALRPAKPEKGHAKRNAKNVVASKGAPKSPAVSAVPSIPAVEPAAVPAPPVAEQTAPETAAPSGELTDQTYPDYLKSHGWRPIKEVLEEVNGGTPPSVAPPTAALPNPPPAPIAPSDPKAPEATDSQH
jgi:serine/threonine-protein kinase